MFTKFESLSNYDLQQECKSSSRLIHMHTQAFKKISQLVNFKLFPCDLSPPLMLVVGGFSKDRKMSYTHSNFDFVSFYGFQEARERDEKRPILIFLSRSTVTFQLLAEIFKFEYLGLYSSDWKNGDSSRKLELERTHGEKTIFRF